MWKIVGVMLLVTGGAAWGFRAAWELRTGEQRLMELSAALTALARELKLGGRGMESMLEHILPQCRGSAETLVRECLGALDRPDRREFPVIWREAVDRREELPEGCRTVLLDLAETLGRCDGRTQQTCLEAACGQLEQLARDLHAQQQGRGRVYQAVGVSGGLFLAILLL